MQSWLANLNLAEYGDLLYNQGYVSPEQLATISGKDQLKALGVTKMGHLSRLVRAIEKLKSDLVGGLEDTLTNNKNSAQQQSLSAQELDSTRLDSELWTWVCVYI